jgi:hypothetical protein
MKSDESEYLRAQVSALTEMLEGAGPVSRLGLTARIEQARERLAVLEAQQEDGVVCEPELVTPTMQDMIGHSGPDLVDTLLWLSEEIINPARGQPDWVMYHLQRSTAGWPDADLAQRLHERVLEALECLRRQQTRANGQQVW